MNKRNTTICMFLFIIGLSGLLFAGSDVNKNEENLQSYEANLLEGLHTDNTGLQISAAYYLGEMKSEKAILPLMKLLRSSKCEDLRIIAALSLIKIESRSSVYMVKSESKFNNRAKIRKLCRQFYLAYLHKNAVDKQVSEQFKYALSISE